MLNFSNIIATTTCANEDRFISVYANAMHLLTSCHKLEFHILLNFTEISDNIMHHCQTLSALADRTGNSLSVHSFDSQVSLAQMYSEFLKTIAVSCGRQYWLSIDDDLFYPYDTLSLISKASNYSADLFLFGFYEVVNRRNYSDWSDTVQNIFDISALISKVGFAKSILHQNYKIPSDLYIIPAPGEHCGAFMANIQSVCGQEAFMEKLSTWPKGLRGVDVEICKSLNATYYIAGATGFHTDQTGAHIDNKLWTVDVPNKQWGS